MRGGVDDWLSWSLSDSFLKNFTASKFSMHDSINGLCLLVLSS